MYNHNIYFELLAFFVVAFLSGMFYSVFYKIIGAPIPKPAIENGRVYHQFERLQITMPNMIFRWYGAWLCRGQEAWQDKYDKSRLHTVRVPYSARLHSDSGRCVGLIKTSYDRGDEVEDITPDEICKTGVQCLDVNQNSRYSWSVVLKMLPGETCYLSYWNERGVTETVYSQPLFPKWTHSNMPLSPYKALGLCPTCTVFWFMIIALISACCVGAFPQNPWYIGLLFPAYGLAAWAQSIIK